MAPHPDFLSSSLYFVGCVSLHTSTYVHLPPCVHTPVLICFTVLCRYVTFRELQRGKTRLYMRGLTIVHAEWLARLVPALCTFAKPLENPEPR